MLSLYKFLKFLFRYAIPEPLRYPLARAAARVVCGFNAPRRTVIVGNLTPLVGRERAKRLAPRVLGNFLMTAVDFFCERRNLAANLPMEHWGLVEKTYRKSKRVMIITAHLGNWEIGINCLVGRGFSVAGLYAPYRDDAIVEWILSHRSPDVEWIPAVRGASEACLHALQRGRVLGVVGDIPFGEKGRRVRIAGAYAHLPLGPWSIAVRGQATVIPAFIIRESPGHYRGVIHEPISVPDGSFRHRLEAMQDIYRAHLESYLLRYPEQWGVLQPFWDSAKGLES
jgi:lauroyl/myristoyl acyltransferase